MQGSQAEKCMEECPLSTGVYAWIHELRNRCKFPVPDSPPVQLQQDSKGCAVLCGLGSGGPLEENLDDLGEEPQPGTLEMCASGIAVLAEGARVRASQTTAL